MVVWTVFPGTASVESDFHVLEWDKIRSHAGISDLILEEILQCEQYLRLAFLEG